MPAGLESQNGLSNQTSEMNDKPPTSSGTGSSGIFKRVVRAIRGEPWSREEIQDLFEHSEDVFDPEEQEMLAGVLEVAETQVRDVMVPRSQMVVIETRPEPG